VDVILTSVEQHSGSCESVSKPTAAKAAALYVPRASVNRAGSEPEPLDLPAGNLDLCCVGKDSNPFRPEKGSTNSESSPWVDVRPLNLLSVNKYDEFLRSRFPVLWEKFRLCGKVGIGFSCPSCGHKQFVPNSCGIRGCPVCGKYQFARIYRRYGEALKRLPQYNLRKVELTAGHIPLDKASLNEWFTAATKVLDHFWKSYFVGLEVSPSGHVHLHAITAGRYVPQRELSRVAGEMLDRPVVYISRNSKVKYLLKDVAKAPEFNSEDLRIRYFLATRGLRMFRSRGLLYGLGEDGRGQGRRARHVCPCCGDGMEFNGFEYREAISVPPPTRDVPRWVADMMEAAGVSV
jgi:hypothetical protein